MKCIITLIGLLANFLCCYAQDVTYLVLQLHDNSNITLELDDYIAKTIEFTDSCVIVERDLEIEYQNLSKIYISDKLPTSIEVTKLPEHSGYIIKDNVIYVTTTPNSYISIYGINGAQIYNRKSASGIETIDLSHLSVGVYILKINTTSIKFRKL